MVAGRVGAIDTLAVQAPNARAEAHADHREGSEVDLGVAVGVPYDPLQLHEHPRAQAAPLACISTNLVGTLEWMTFYNNLRLHQGLEGRTPMAVWRAGVDEVSGILAVDMLLRLDNADALPTYPQRLLRRFSVISN